jgi:hypothetical protein
MAQLLGTASNQVPTNGDLGTAAFMDSSGFYGTGLNPAFRNLIINGDMRIDQRTAGSSATYVNADDDTYKTLDRWCLMSVTAGGSTTTVQRVADAPSGFYYSLRVTMPSSTPTISSNDGFALIQRIEGLNIAHLGWGTTNAKPITISFWVKSSVAGTFPLAVANNNSINANYVKLFNTSAANTWEYKSITIPGNSSFATNIDTLAAIYVMFGFGAGSGRTAAVADLEKWVSSTNRKSAVTGYPMYVNNNSATFQVTGVQVEVGTQATAFEYRPMQTELALCQRYFQYSRYYFEYAMGAQGTLAGPVVQFPVSMRGTPTFTVITTAGSNTTPSGPTVASYNGIAYGYLVGYASGSSGYGYRDTQYQVSAEI